MFMMHWLHWIQLRQWELMELAQKYYKEPCFSIVSTHPPSSIICPRSGGYIWSHLSSSQEINLQWKTIDLSHSSASFLKFWKEFFVTKSFHLSPVTFPHINLVSGGITPLFNSCLSSWTLYMSLLTQLHKLMLSTLILRKLLTVLPTMNYFLNFGLWYPTESLEMV